MLKCPVCSASLEKNAAQFICKNGHSFDIARSGYVNLAHKHKPAGDNKEMVKARTAFLEQGAYSFLRTALAQRIQSLHPKVLLDVGCGQGWYTGVLAQYADVCIGVDLSKEALLYASRHDKKSQYMLASIFDLPLEKDSVDVAVSIFTPIPDQELLRVLKPGGYFIAVSPGPRHLWELKSLLYETVYENPAYQRHLSGFREVSSEILQDSSVVANPWDLFEMTPYRYKSPKAGMDAVAAARNLPVTFEFVVSVYQKESI